MASRIPPTYEELLATLQRSSLPTVLVEGDDDIIIYRNIEARMQNTRLNFQPCYSRTTLLKLYKQRHTFPKKVKFAFVADSDLYVLSNTPEEYKDVIFTYGYSIENDLYASGARVVDNVLRPDELTTKEAILLEIATWFAAQIKKAGAQLDINLLNETVMQKNSIQFLSSFLQEHDFIRPTAAEIAEITAEKYRKLRGKLIFQSYFKIFQHIRPIKNTKDTKYSDAQIFEMCVGEAMNNRDPHPINRLVNTLRQVFI
jgi:hypothetical protein